LQLKRKNLFFAGIGLLILLGCAKVPVKEIEAVKKENEAAQKAQAPIYAKEHYDRAMVLYDSAVANIKKQYKMIPLLRSYKKAISFLTDATAGFVSADSIAVGNKNRLYAEADTLIQQATQELEVLQKRFTGVTKQGKKVDSLLIRLTEAKKMLDDAGVARVDGDIAGATNNAKTILKTVTTLTKELKTLPVGKGKREKIGKINPE
jgi:hypothetical protein